MIEVEHASYPVFFLQSMFSSHGLQVILSVVELPAYIYAVISRLKKIIICQQSIISISFLLLSCLDVADWLVGKEACLLPVTHLHWSCSHCIGFHWGFFQLPSCKVMPLMKHFHAQRIIISQFSISLLTCSLFQNQSFKNGLIYVAKNTISACFGIVFIYTAEPLPTCVRWLQKRKFFVLQC